MSAPNVSRVIGTPDGRHVVHETTSSALAAALTRAELDRRGIPRERVEEREAEA